MNTEAASSYVSGLFKNLNRGQGFLYGGEGPQSAWDHHHHDPAHHVSISNTKPVVIGVHEEEPAPLARVKTKGVVFNDGDNGKDQDKVEDAMEMDFEEEKEVGEAEVI